MPCVAVERLLFKIQASGEVRLVARQPKNRKVQEIQNNAMQSADVKIEPKSESQSIQEMLSELSFAIGDRQSANSDDRFSAEDLSSNELHTEGSKDNPTESDVPDRKIKDASTKNDVPLPVAEQRIRTFAGHINSSKRHKLSRVPCPIARYSLDKLFRKCCTISDPRRESIRKRAPNGQHSRQPAISSWAHTLGIRYGKEYLFHCNFFSF